MLLMSRCHPWPGGGKYPRPIPPPMSPKRLNILEWWTTCSRESHLQESKHNCSSQGGGPQRFTTNCRRTQFKYSYLLVCVYLLLAECEVRTASYGPNFFLPFRAWAMKTRKKKTRIHNLPYGPRKRG